MTYSLAMAAGLEADDIRALFHLTGELRGAGEGSCSLARAPGRGPRGAVWGPGGGGDRAVGQPGGAGAQGHAGGGQLRHRGQPPQIRDRGLPPTTRQRFYEEIYWTSHRLDDTLAPIIDLYGTAFTVRRADVVDDGRWQRSIMANERYRRHGCGDFIMSMAPVDHLGVVCWLEVFRAWGEPASPRATG